MYIDIDIPQHSTLTGSCGTCLHTGESLEISQMGTSPGTRRTGDLAKSWSLCFPCSCNSPPHCSWHSCSLRCCDPRSASAIIWNWRIWIIGHLLVWVPMYVSSSSSSTSSTSLLENVLLVRRHFSSKILNQITYMRTHFKNLQDFSGLSPELNIADLSF